MMNAKDTPEYPIIERVRAQIKLVRGAESLTKREKEVCEYHLGVVHDFLEARVGRRLGGNIRVRGRSVPRTHEGGRSVPL